MKTRSLALFALLLPSIASAQAYQCRAPQIRNVPTINADGPVRDVPITGYTLALSWSPEFCKGREGQRSHRIQCSGDHGRFAFVVHGLWPHSQTGGRSTWPQWCRAREKLTPAVIRRNLCTLPSARLIARQWAKHGTCMTRRPDTYFAVTRILWEALRVPEYDRISREDDLTAGRIRQAFADANPGLAPSAVGVKLNERGWLQELRICYSQRFRPTRCNAARYGARDEARAKIWRGM
ncbi:ribonuclease T [Erythrobacter sp. YT30]|uniref:ribonuclease T2 family protein n=1 Tax=Erythrobacter sp. YT30 TaxID=1735012 RepID=UPI00076DA636|nr:ribonuclease T [Erythrobacter sp. YT30]KWV91468.1 ribonuclease T [Erythrobacter sp. YT30]